MDRGVWLGGVDIGGEARGLFRRFGITGTAAGILMILFGVLIIVFPVLIAWLIGVYLIIAGVLQLAGHTSVLRK